MQVNVMAMVLYSLCFVAVVNVFDDRGGTEGGSVREDIPVLLVLLEGLSVQVPTGGVTP